jgi:hypothetical protein
MGTCATKMVAEDEHLRIVKDRDMEIDRLKSLLHCTRARESTYDHVAMQGGRLIFRAVDAEHPETSSKLRRLDRVSRGGRRYSVWFLIHPAGVVRCGSLRAARRAYVARHGPKPPDRARRGQYSVASGI